MRKSAKRRTDNKKKEEGAQKTIGVGEVMAVSTTVGQTPGWHRMKEPGEKYFPLNEPGIQMEPLNAEKCRLRTRFKRSQT